MVKDDEGYVTHSELRQYLQPINASLNRIILALWGENGRGGIVGDVRDLKTKGRIGERIITFLIGIIGAVIGAYIIKAI